MRMSRGGDRANGQALVEFALVFPLFVFLLFSIIVFGLYVFYNQQLANAVAQAARYAAVHSSSSICPTVSRLEPADPIKPLTYGRCDRPEDGWPNMVAAARSSIWGMNASGVSVTGCWSGYVDGTNNYDALPVDPATSMPNTFANCTMRGLAAGSLPISPQTDPGAVPCPATTVGSSSTPPKADGDDKASATAASTGTNTSYPTTVTVYACFNWVPPMAGFVLIPSQITLRAVVTEALQRQQ
jgi:TadE-like protein